MHRTRKRLSSATEGKAQLVQLLIAYSLTLLMMLLYFIYAILYDLGAVVAAMGAIFASGLSSIFAGVFYYGSMTKNRYTTAFAEALMKVFARTEH